MSDQVQLVFLGTGAAVPSPRRALPTLALLFSGETVLCDCSEGTQQRLMSAGISPSRIRNIFISHLHGDHIFGLPGLLTSQHLLGREAPMAIWGPSGIRQYLDGIAEVTGHRSRFPLEIHEMDRDGMKELKLDHITVLARRLEHSKICYGFRICANPRFGRFDQAKAESLGIPEGPQWRALQEGKSIILSNGCTIDAEQVVGPARFGPCIAYCTDTRPCAASRSLAEGADVLLHDSTFLHELQPLAQETGHSTASEAAEVARLAGAKRLFLWHLSSRHDEDDAEAMLAQARAHFPNSFIPEDLASWSIPKSIDE